MWRLRWPIVALGLLLVIAPSIADAQCDEDFRRVELDKNVGPERNVVRLRSYVCRAEARSDSPKITVEFHRLSDLAASLIIAKQSSAILRELIGSPKVIENEVFKTYSDLLQKFGTLLDIGDMPNEFVLAYRFDAAGAGGSAWGPDELRQKNVRVLTTSNPLEQEYYPAIKEMDALSRKIIPAGLRYFYRIQCSDDRRSSSIGVNAVCNTYDPSKQDMMFWRPMRADDVATYSRKINVFNRRYVSTRSRTSSIRPLPVAVPKVLRLANHFAGDNWPDDFMILRGQGFLDAAFCGNDNQGLQYSMRVVILDVVVIENVSNGTLTINDILGGRSSDSGLRVASSSGSLAGSGNSLGNTIVLAPGEKVLVPIKITLNPNETVINAFRYRQASNEIYRRKGASGFTGNTGYGAPTFKTYVYGREIAIGGFRINDIRVNLPNRSANFMELTWSLEAGSCPYLLSWDSRSEGWADHGKVLHKAPNKEREYTETKMFPGFKQRFRLEEREPEIAFIDEVALSIALKSGETFTLKPANARLAARDGDYLQLYWGDAVDIKFVLPDGIAADDVVESQFSITGFYERYSSIVEQDGSEERRNAGSDSRLMLRGAVQVPQNSLANGPMCPVPARLPTLLAKPF
jgi:hypothetical protein